MPYLLLPVSLIAQRQRQRRLAMARLVRDIETGVKRKVDHGLAFRQLSKRQIMSDLTYSLDGYTHAKFNRLCDYCEC
jgi:hypothetical protein